MVSAQAALASAQATLASAEASQTAHVDVVVDAASTGSAAHHHVHHRAVGRIVVQTPGTVRQVDPAAGHLTSDQTQADTDSCHSSSTDLQHGQLAAATILDHHVDHRPDHGGDSGATAPRAPRP